MPIRQGIRTLPLYDILATLLPGLAFLIGVFFLSGVNVESTSGAYLTVFFVVFGYIIGTVLRWVGREFEDTPVFFSNSRKIAVGTIDEGDVKERSPLAPGRWFNSLPFYENKSTNDIPRIEPTAIEESIDDIVLNKFNLSNTEVKSGRLLQLLLSHLESTPYNRAIRFQAIHSFKRNTWAAMVLLSLLSLLVILNKIALIFIAFPEEFIILRTNIPNWGTIFVIAIGTTLLAMIFGELKTKANELFIEYVFNDIYLDYQLKDK